MDGPIFRGKPFVSAGVNVSIHLWYLYTYTFTVTIKINKIYIGIYTIHGWCIYIQFECLGFDFPRPIYIYIISQFSKVVGQPGLCATDLARYVVSGKDEPLEALPTWDGARTRRFFNWIKLPPTSNWCRISEPSTV